MRRAHPASYKQFIRWIDTPPLYHCKPSKCRETKISRHKAVKKDDLHNQAHKWRDEVQLSDKFPAHEHDFIRMPTEYQAMWDGHSNHEIVAKSRIEILEDTAKPFYTALHRDGPKTTELEKVNIDKMPAEKVFEPAQTKWQHQ